jgi:hypothetical protein
MKNTPDNSKIFPGETIVVPPDAVIDGGVSRAYDVNPDDVREIVFNAQTGITEIRMKRRGTYRGKRYDRRVFPFKLNNSTTQ